MKNKILILIGAVLLSVAITTTLDAQTTAFTYQGRLLTTNGPANGSYDLQFTLFDAQANGNPLGTPWTNSAVAISNGLFTVTVDFGNRIRPRHAGWASACEATAWLRSAP
ncbi:MAG TPA: hypothetical protein VFY06_12690 [Verrucomicrobiae bacterium]|nr:hypothetical protein [Verrucomicrobiae bacterium]